MITAAQKKVIGYIEQNLRITFDGSTKEEARDFISKYMEKSKQATLSYEQISIKHSVNRDAILLSLMGDNDSSTKFGHEVHKKDMFGSYNQDRNGDIFDDEGYDYHAYADIMNSTF